MDHSAGWLPRLFTLSAGGLSGKVVLPPCAYNGRYICIMGYPRIPGKGYVGNIWGVCGFDCHRVSRIHNVAGCKRMEFCQLGTIVLCGCARRSVFVWISLETVGIETLEVEDLVGVPLGALRETGA